MVSNLAITYSSIDNVYYGLSTDTKPTGVDITAKFYEYDTKNIYIYDGTTWRAM